ncbi:hypothetical protein HMSSN036_69240 [Paenibacillus macerans]|nr:hypothetical protein HMSSN036_69240 [Paenibacillus macerans]
MFRALNRAKVGRKYIIQQGIHLATISGRPIDYRVKVVKSNGTWVYRAMVGRLARPGLFVTNLCKGGTMLSAHAGLVRSLGRKASIRKTPGNAIADQYLCAHFGKYFSGHRVARV